MRPYQFALLTVVLAASRATSSPMPWRVPGAGEGADRLASDIDASTSGRDAIRALVRPDSIDSRSSSSSSLAHSSVQGHYRGFGQEPDSPISLSRADSRISHASWDSVESDYFDRLRLRETAPQLAYMSRSSSENSMVWGESSRGDEALDRQGWRYSPEHPRHAGDVQSPSFGHEDFSRLSIHSPPRQAPQGPEGTSYGHEVNRNLAATLREDEERRRRGSAFTSARRWFSSRRH